MWVVVVMVNADNIKSLSPFVLQISHNSIKFSADTATRAPPIFYFPWVDLMSSDLFFLFFSFWCKLLRRYCKIKVSAYQCVILLSVSSVARRNNIKTSLHFQMKCVPDVKASVKTLKFAIDVMETVVCSTRFTFRINMKFKCLLQLPRNANRGEPESGC